jgi:hypothetical protein
MLCLMRITLDHNCIIHLEQRTEIGAQVETIVTTPSNQCYVVNIGASEMREKGVRPEHYERFEELLTAARIEHLPRLNPMLIFDVTFWDRCIWASDEMTVLAQNIESTLFGNAQPIDVAGEGLDSPAGRKWLNRICDIHTMWCHIQNGNEIFITTDGNFKKATKLPKLHALGAGRICHPCEL